MVCPICGVIHSPPAGCPRLQQVALSLNLFAVPAFLTDPLNRFVWVNHKFANTIGDPIRDHLPVNMRFVAAAILGPYRDRFPQGKRQVARCISGLFNEVEAGRLAPGTLCLIEDTLALDNDLRKAACRSSTPWDGTLLTKSYAGKMLMVREQVVAVADARGKPSSFHVSLWLPVEKDVPTCLAGLLDSSTGVAALLTPRQLEIACWYSTGLTSKGVATRAAITVGTARDHLEEIYSRLGVHSRAELTALLVREGLV